ncbi:MAG: hypothetical protein LUD72_07465 [Bacteroidales bacterium]|nr:hypothetical protein [Bacteroidales bacterium]
MIFNPNKTYTLSELRAVIAESTKPVVGKNVVTDDKKNNEKAVKDIIKDVEKLVPDTEKKDVAPQVAKDINKTTLDANFAYEPGKEYKERIEAEVKGFPSKQNQKTSGVNENESLDTEGNDEFYEGRKEINKEQGEMEADGKHAGLKSHNMSKNLYKNKSVFGEGKKMKRLVFKNTEFLNENQVISRIPDEYKTDGNTFVMMDRTGTEFLIECKRDAIIKNYVHVNVTNSVNLQKLDESIGRMKELANYKHSDFNKAGTIQSRKAADESLNEMVTRVKTLTEGHFKTQAQQLNEFYDRLAGKKI